MNPEVKKLWVEDLRNPEVKQCTGALNNGSGFCCLGRLTEIFRVSDANTGKHDWVDSPAGHSIKRFMGIGGVPHEVIRTWAGLDKGFHVTVTKTHFDKYGPYLGSKNTMIANHVKPGRSTSVISLNEFSVPFPVIADIIESSL